jgi:YVTN family beta-propeller protein
VFVSNRVANTISLIDTQTLTVVDELPGPGGPDDMDLTADGRTLLLASRWARKLSVIDIETSKKVVRQIDVGARRTASGRWTMRRGSSTAVLALRCQRWPWPGWAAACAKPVYLSFDTGHMGVAPLVAEVLKRHA